MSVPVEQFVKQLEDSGIVSGDTLKDFIPPKAAPKDARELAQELVRKKKLTKFQAEEVFRGKGKSSLVLDNYLLLEKIGQGGMGQVFKARHRRMDRIVAVKILPAHLMKDPATIARFEREVRAAARITHPNIVTAFDAGKAGSVHFLVMEFVDGSDLSALVKRNGPLPVEQAVNCILQSARGLEAAHAKGIVHRDIKPANLLLDNMGTVKILDMGLARIEKADGGVQSDLTATGVIMGTVDYMAPEQAINAKGADHRADIYSLGISLYYLLAGKAAYSGETLMEKLMAHQNQPIPSLLAVHATVPHELDAVFQKMVAKKVEDRYQSMSEVIADLALCGPRQGQALKTQPVFKAATDTDFTNFLNDMAAAPIVTAPPKKKKSEIDKQKLVLISGGILGVLVLVAGLAFSLKAKEGTRIAKVKQPDADREVFSGEGTVEVRKADVRKAEVRKSPVARPETVVSPAKVAVQPTKGAVQNDAQALQGEWITIHEDYNGEVFTPAKVAEINRRFVFKDNALNVTRTFDGAFGEYDGHFELDPQAGHFDWSGYSPGGERVQWKGIYQLSGDRLKVCFNYVENANTGRPKAFQSQGQSARDCVNLVLQRRRK